MTVENISRRAGPFIGDGTVTAFPFEFKVFNETQIAVHVADGDNPETVLTLNEDYTVALNEDQNQKPGGTVILLAPLGNEKRLAIISVVAATQTMRSTNYDRFYPETYNDAFDKATILIQQLLEQVSRALITDPTDTITPRQLRDKLLAAVDEAVAAAGASKETLAACEAIKDLIERYSWDIPHLVNSIEEVEAYPYDGYFWVKGYGNPGNAGEDISNRLVGGETLGKLFKTIAEKLAEITGIVSVVSFGVVGDGKTDDTTAIQNALNAAVGKAVFFPGTMSFAVSQVVIPNGVQSLDFRGSTLIKTTSDAAALQLDGVEGVTVSNLRMRDASGNERHGFIRGLGVKNVVFENLDLGTSTAYDGVTGNWAVTLSGENIRINGIDIRSYGKGLWSDGLHFGRVKNLVLNNFNIATGDDCIAFYQDKVGGTGDFENAPSENINISNGVLSSSDANCFKLGMRLPTDGTAFDQATIKNLLCSGVSFAGRRAIATRSAGGTPTAVADNIIFSGCDFYFRDDESAVASTISLTGTPMNRVAFMGCAFDFGDSGSYAMNFKSCNDVLLMGCEIRSGGATIETIETINADSCKRFTIKGSRYYTQTTNSICRFNSVEELIIEQSDFNLNKSFAVANISGTGESSVIRFSGNYVSNASNVVNVSGSKDIAEFVFAYNVLKGATTPYTPSINAAWSFIRE